jgi:hypothetical protein
MSRRRAGGGTYFRERDVDECLRVKLFVSNPCGSSTTGQRKKKVYTSSSGEPWKLNLKSGSAAQSASGDRQFFWSGPLRWTHRGVFACCTLQQWSTTMYPRLIIRSSSLPVFDLATDLDYQRSNHYTQAGYYPPSVMPLVPSQEGIS